MDVARLGPARRRRRARADVGHAWHRGLLRLRRAGRPPARRRRRSSHAARAARAAVAHRCTPVDSARLLLLLRPPRQRGQRRSQLELPRLRSAAARQRGRMPEVHPLPAAGDLAAAEESEEAIGAYVAKHGGARVSAALTGGQYAFPEGPFLRRGARATWSNRTLRSVLRRHASGRRRVAWIDYHTGTRPAGARREDLCGRNVAARAALARRAWWGDEMTSFYDGSSTSASVVGVHHERGLRGVPGAAGIHRDGPRIRDRAAAAGASGVARRPLAAQSPRSARDAARRRSASRCAMAFYVDADDWKEQVYAQARSAALRTVERLADPLPVSATTARQMSPEPSVVRPRNNRIAYPVRET